MHRRQPAPRRTPWSRPAPTAGRSWRTSTQCRQRICVAWDRRALGPDRGRLIRSATATAQPQAVLDGREDPARQEQDDHQEDERIDDQIQLDPAELVGEVLLARLEDDGAQDGTPVSYT